jgi:hypothetical protein
MNFSMILVYSDVKKLINNEKNNTARLLSRIFQNYNFCNFFERSLLNVTYHCTA